MNNNTHGNRGQIPLDSKHAAEVHNQALERAAAHLEKTAADFEQMAAQKQRDIGPAGSHHQAEHTRLRQLLAEMNALSEKAHLLRGQAGHIREMKVTV